MTGVDQEVGALSGGNQQKVVLAKWLATGPRVLILDEPTRGIDIGAKVEVHRIIAELAASGLAIILISSDLPEVLAMSDRIVVLHEGRITAEIPRDRATQESVMFAATGSLAADEAGGRRHDRGRGAPWLRRAAVPAAGGPEVAHGDRPPAGAEPARDHVRAGRRRLADRAAVPDREQHQPGRRARRGRRGGRGRRGDRDHHARDRPLGRGHDRPGRLQRRPEPGAPRCSTRSGRSRWASPSASCWA